MRVREELRQFTKPAYDHYLTSPFLTFFETRYALDSEYRARHPIHIQMGKMMYGHASGVSLILIRAIKTRYRDTFLLAIERDQEQGVIRAAVDRFVLADLCVHFMTDNFIFQNLSERMTLHDMRSHLRGTIDLIRRGIE